MDRSVRGAPREGCPHRPQSKFTPNPDCRYHPIHDMSDKGGGLACLLRRANVHHIPPRWPLHLAIAMPLFHSKQNRVAATGVFGKSGGQKLHLLDCIFQKVKLHNGLSLLGFDGTESGWGESRGSAGSWVYFQQHRSVNYGSGNR